MGDTFINFEAIPEYRAAVEREELVRDLAFSGLPEYIGGIEVQPFTFRHWLWLTTIESPFLNATPPDAKAVDDFFWTVSPVRRLRGGPQRWAKFKYLWPVGWLKQPDRLINEYLLEAFMDAPAGRAGHGGERVSYFSAGAAVIHRLCSAYGGLTPDQVMDLPLKAGFQLIKLIDRQNSSAKTLLFNPSDSLKSRLLAKITREPDCEEARLAVTRLN